ncbi:putative GPI-anchored protein pfl2 [Lucilia sericata]|uniref:putative GPI-anchored protein pfl2 n=1 Tax=Lucilia sericata TaxID=13632 RepID=UPI0018A81031|nr:putative GPI-anchored protein pfl2 [Lucilia sericata]
MAHENDQQQQQNTKNQEEEAEKPLDDSFKTNNKNESCDVSRAGKETLDDSLVMPTASKGKLNDLVADLCINGHRASQPTASQTAFGDYTNIRATLGPVAVNDNNFTTAALDANNLGVCSNAAPTHNVQPQPPTQNSSFSFKHFLSSNSVPTAPSTTVTSLDPPANSTSTTSSASNATTSTRSLQTSTGARPKVPQSNSVTSTSISSLTVGGLNDSQTSATKMKRSPRFSSFDSQASLAEYAGSSTTADLPAAEASAGSSTDFQLYPDERERDRFQEWQLPSNAPTMTTNSTDYDRGSSYVPRSYSNYDMPRPQTSPRRRVGIGGATTKDTRPTRLALHTNQNPTTAAKLKLDLPLTSNSTGANGAGAAAGSSRKPTHCSRPTDFHTSNPMPAGSAAAAALPDFVQDHWMDSWYANDMHVNSPPSSPTNNFMEDLSGAAGGSAAIHNHNSHNRALHLDSAPIPGPADRGDFNMGLPEPSNSSVGSKMLPDFLSDGPIIHSSQRLADVAAGLPSNSIGSPEESSINNQLSRLRSDNERLQRELNESILALNEQTLRANNLERQLMEQQRQHQTETEETLDSNKKRSTAAQTHMAKLKQQVQQLTAEVEMLRREKELMREEGAVGGCSIQSCDRSYAAAAVSSTTRNSSTAAVAGTAIGSGSSGGGVGNVTGSSVAAGAALGIRPSRQHQLSRDLRRAASNAEQNLKQLLAGVENLRQMAANLEKSETHVDYDASPDLFSDFLDECDDYDEYPGGGPAL